MTKPNERFSVDPNVFNVAEMFVSDTIKGLGLTIGPVQQVAFVRRVAQAMQDAAELECQAIEDEMKGPRDGRR